MIFSCKKEAELMNEIVLYVHNSGKEIDILELKKEQKFIPLLVDKVVRFSFFESPILNTDPHDLDNLDPEQNAIQEISSVSKLSSNSLTQHFLKDKGFLKHYRGLNIQLNPWQRAAMWLTVSSAMLQIIVASGVTYISFKLFMALVIPDFDNL